MLITIFTFLVILTLTFINGLTDATNAISTLVGTKVMSFRKACMLSAIFDMIGIFVMYYINDSVVDCISTIAILPSGTRGLTVLCTGMMAAIAFSFSAMLLGIPTSESHGLISGITGAAIAIMRN
jgi:PiT family inorganic phosphate transporter